MDSERETKRRPGTQSAFESAGKAFLLFFAAMLCACSSPKATLTLLNNPLDCLKAERAENGDFCFSPLLSSASSGSRLSMGPLISRYREERKISQEILAGYLSRTGFIFSALSPEDLKYPPSEMRTFIKRSSVPLLSSNVYLKSGKPFPGSRKFIVFSGENFKCAFLSLLVPDEDIRKASVMKYFRIERPDYEFSRTLSALKKENVKNILVFLRAVKGNPSEAAGKFRFNRGDFNLFFISDCPLKNSKGNMICAGGNAGLFALNFGLRKGLFENFRIRAKSRRENGKYAADEKAAIKRVSSEIEKKLCGLKSPLPVGEGKYSSPLADFMAENIRKDSALRMAVFPLPENARELKNSIRLKDIYSLAGDSSMVYLKMRGKDLESAVISNLPKRLGLSNIKVVFSDGKGTVFANGRKIRPNAVYKIAAPDFFLENDEYGIKTRIMEFIYTGRKISDILKKRLKRVGEAERAPKTVWWLDS